MDGRGDEEETRGGWVGCAGGWRGGVRSWKKNCLQRGALHVQLCNLNGTSTAGRQAEKGRAQTKQRARAGEGGRESVRECERGREEATYANWRSCGLVQRLCSIRTTRCCSLHKGEG